MLRSKHLLQGCVQLTSTSAVMSPLRTALSRTPFPPLLMRSPHSEGPPSPLSMWQMARIQDPTQPSPLGLGLFKESLRPLPDTYHSLCHMNQPRHTPHALGVEPAALVIFLSITHHNAQHSNSTFAMFTKGLCGRHCARCFIHINSCRP